MQPPARHTAKASRNQRTDILTPGLGQAFQTARIWLLCLNQAFWKPLSNFGSPLQPNKDSCTDNFWEAGRSTTGAGLCKILSQIDA